MFTLLVTGLILLALLAGLRTLVGAVLAMVFVLRLANLALRSNFRVHSILIWGRQGFGLTEVKAN